jgi:uncharacterized membrane protein YkoI
MTDKLKNITLIVASITALALGGSAIAGAASGGSSNNGSSSDNSSARAANRGPVGFPPQRTDETLLTGDTAAQVRKAALAKVSGTIERVETDADGNAAYEAHMVRSDGTRVTVYVDKSFDVVSVKSGA